MVTCLLEISILNVIDLVPSATMFPAHGVLMVSVTFTAATVTVAIRTGVIGAGVTGTGVIGTGVIGAGVIGAGVIGAGVVGAGVIGAGVVGAGAIVVGAGSAVVMIRLAWVVQWKCHLLPVLVQSWWKNISSE